MIIPEMLILGIPQPRRGTLLYGFQEFLSFPRIRKSSLSQKNHFSNMPCGCQAEFRNFLRLSICRYGWKNSSLKERNPWFSKYLIPKPWQI